MTDIRAKNDRDEVRVVRDRAGFHDFHVPEFEALQSIDALDGACAKADDALIKDKILREFGNIEGAKQFIMMIQAAILDAISTVFKSKVLNGMELESTESIEVHLYQIRADLHGF